MEVKERKASKHTIAGNILECHVCGHDEFWTRKTLMNTPGMSFFNLDWANRSALNYICNSCGYMMWFISK